MEGINRTSCSCACPSLTVTTGDTDASDISPTMPLVIAAIWAMSDIGWVSSPYGKIAFVFFTWAVLEIALYRVFFSGGD
jgi:hypothetical protein